MNCPCLPVQTDFPQLLTPHHFVIHLYQLMQGSSYMEVPISTFVIVPQSTGLLLPLLVLHFPQWTAYGIRATRVPVTLTLKAQHRTQNTLTAPRLTGKFQATFRMLSLDADPSLPWQNPSFCLIFHHN